MKNIQIALLLFLFSPTVLCAQTTWYVPDDFPSIQEAISDASVLNGDTVIVRPGTYMENLNMQGKAITLTSETGAEETILDGGQAGLHSVIECSSYEDENTVIKGFTLRNGTGYFLGHIGNVGGGIYNHTSSPTVMDCIFRDNNSHRGGGMFNIYNSSPIVLRCTFIENNAGLAGAMYNWDSCSPIVEDCSFIRNTAGTHHGAVYNQSYSNAEFNNCSFIENSSDGSTGALHSTTSCAIKVANCTFYGNSALYSGAVGVTSAGSTTAVFANCIFWGNTPNQIGTYEADPLITYCCVQGGWPGAGNIDSDPLFADPLNHDFHLTYPSPCRNAGHNGGVLAANDFEGDPRIAGGTVDMGVDEFHQHLYYTGDATPGGSIEAKFVGVPATNPVGLLLGSGVLPSPVGTAWGDFYLSAPWWIFWLFPIPADGILEIPATVPLSPAAPYDIPLQALIGLDPDSMTNLSVLKIR